MDLKLEAELLESPLNWLVLKLPEDVVASLSVMTLEILDVVETPEAYIVVVAGTSITTTVVVSTDPSDLVRVVSLVVVQCSEMLSETLVVADKTSEVPLTLEVLTGSVLETVLLFLIWSS